MGALTCPTEFAPLERTQESKNLDVQLRIMDPGIWVRNPCSPIWRTLVCCQRRTKSDPLKLPPTQRKILPPLAGCRRRGYSADGRWHTTRRHAAEEKTFWGAEDKNSGKSVAQSRNELLTQCINFVVWMSSLQFTAWT